MLVTLARLKRDNEAFDITGLSGRQFSVDLLALDRKQSAVSAETGEGGVLFRVGMEPDQENIRAVPIAFTESDPDRRIRYRRDGDGITTIERTVESWVVALGRDDAAPLGVISENASSSGVLEWQSKLSWADIAARSKPLVLRVEGKIDPVSTMICKDYDIEATEATHTDDKRHVCLIRATFTHIALIDNAQPIADWRGR